MESPARSLPTPPGTSHRAEKENCTPHFTRVAWSERNEIHTLTATPTRGKSIQASGSTKPPTRSILKNVRIFLPAVDENQREVTPEPSDPLVDLSYLERCVHSIIATETLLHDLIESYTTLAFRIRACVSGNTDADASWPLFQPIRKNREAFVNALVRDLGRALENPLEGDVKPEETDLGMEAEDLEETCDDTLRSLPSPQKSPKKKRKGMTADQVKHARDLCTTSHAALRLLAAAFTMPAMYQLFSEQELRFILTHVLAIPLKDSLPTPNARKTCALAIYLIQIQRLPDEVLEPAKDRIAYALRRGIEGELGKEGKKGSISDGLKAIHDLATTYPAIFVPAFADLLPSIFSCLLGPTYMIRAQACSALGGLALASASIPPSIAHSRLSAYVASYLSFVPPGTPSKKGSPLDDSAIVRTLRMLLKTNDPSVAAQGPVWALCVMAYCIVLLRNETYLNGKVANILMALFSLALRHVKSSVRGLACLVWRAMIWAYFSPPLIKLPSEDGSEGEQEVSEDDEETGNRYGKLWKLVTTVVDMGAGVSSIGALLSVDSEDNIRRALSLLRKMSLLGGKNCKDALDVACQLVAQGPEKEWEPMRLLPNALFSTNPGLMTLEYNQLAQTVRPILNQCPHVEDVRSLTEEELSQSWVFMGLLNVWMEGLRNLKLFWGCKDLPEEIHEIWSRLLQVNFKTLNEADDEAGLRRFIDGVVDVLITILEEDELDFSSESDDKSSNILPTTPIDHSSSWLKLALKLFAVEHLWVVVRDTVSRDVLTEPAEKFLSYLSRREPKLVTDIHLADRAHTSWARLCATVALACDATELVVFFGGRRCPVEQRRSWEWQPVVRSQIWTHFVKVWSDSQANWESGVLLLAFPFGSNSSWELDNEHLDDWDMFLRFTMDKALDFGVDSVAVLDQIATTILTDHSPTHTSATRVADMLLTHLDISDARQVPFGLLEFVNDTLTSSYPPEQRNIITSMWLLRTLARLIEECPVELAENLLELLQDGLSVWISDAYEALTPQEYELDVLSLYQTILVSMQSLPISLSTLDALSPALHAAFTGRAVKPESTKEAFGEYWQATYANKDELTESLPEKIVTCLDILYNRGEGSTLSRMDTDNSDSEVSDLLVPASEPSTPKARALELPPAFLLQPSDVSELGTSTNPIQLPATPQSSARTTPPHKPSKSPKAYDLTSDTPPLSSIFGIASNLVTPKKSPESRRLSASGRSLPNKENMSPMPVFASIAERIASSMSPAPSTTLGKRRALHEEEDAEEAESLKRHKKSMSLSRLFEQDGASMEMLQESAPSTPDDLSLHPRMRKMAMLADTPQQCHTLPTMKTRRRKGVFMDAVEVTITPRLRKRASTESIQNVSSDANRPTIPLRRAKSALKLTSHANASAGPSSRKRRRDSLDAEDCALQTPRKRSVSSASSSPSREVFEPILAGSDDSIMLATPSGRRSPKHDMSSDDDPHIGQVTPHRLVSPAMRRVQNEDSDPPSDDSVLAASPTRDHVARRRSAGKVMIEKLAPLVLGKHRRSHSEKNARLGSF